LKLLHEKSCAIAPGSAFDTSDPSRSNNAQAIDGGGGDSAMHDVGVNSRYHSVLEQFCRVSLANSEDNVREGMHLICDLLEELESRL